MILLYLLAAGMVAWFILTRAGYLIKGSPEKQREEAACRQLMDQLTEEASYYIGRPVSEEEILSKGQDFNRRNSHRGERK